MATLTGERFHRANGYEPGAAIEHPLSDGATIRFVPMQKQLGAR